MENANRGRNLVRHTYRSGVRGPVVTRKPGKPGGGGGKPPSAGVPQTDASDDEPEDEPEVPTDELDDKSDVLDVVSLPMVPLRPIDIRKPKDLLDIPLLITEDDLRNISTDDSEDYEAILVESTLLPKEWDEAVTSSLLPGSGISGTNELADVLITSGGLVAAPGVPKPNAVVGIGMAKTGDIIKSLNEGDYTGAVYDASPIAALSMDEQSGAIDRMVKTAGLVGSLISGDFGGAIDNLTTPATEAEERKPSGHIGSIGGGLTSYGEALGSGLSSGFSNLDKVGEGFKVIGNIFNAASKFDSMTDYVTSLPGIRKIEEDRYYTVYFYPRKGITYIEWKPTEDVRNILSRSKFKDVMREWTEDFVAAAGVKVPAWSRRVKHILAKYGPESDTVKHYGYSRGGGLATHLGGTGYGTGYFSPYAPTKKSKSKLSGDLLHDVIINPMSYMLLLRKKVPLM